MREQSIIIIAAKQMDIDECSTLIREDFSAIYSCTNIPEVRELLKEHKSSILIFNHDSLKQSFNFYQNLFHNKKKAQDSLITTILLCKAADADSAYKLVKQKIFDDYIIFKPLYDPHRLSLTLQSLSNERSVAASNKELEKQLVDLAGKAIVLYRALGETMSFSSDTREQAQSIYANLKDSVIEQVNSVPTQLASSEWQDAVKVLEPEVLQQCISDFTEQSINKQFQQTKDSLQQTVDQWIDGVKEEVASGVELLETAAAGFDAGGKKILIVDEDEIYSCTLQSILEEVGYSVNCESAGEKGLRRMAMMQPDHVLMDYDLSDMTGLDFLKKAKGSNLLQHIPIILLTAHTEREIVKKSISSGAKGYIVKPANREAILSQLRDKPPGSSVGNG